MDVFVKICGIASWHDAMEVAALKPDALGFVLWPDSPRHVKAADLIHWLPKVSTTAVKVGVFVDPEPAEAVRIARAAGLDVIQVHKMSQVARFDICGIRVWQAVYADRMRAERPAACVDAYVADTYSKELPGGTGKTGDWEAVRVLVRTGNLPVVLAGGLNETNVKEALHAVNPWGVDVSSGVEIEPGRKDIGKVREFIHLCRTA